MAENISRYYKIIKDKVIPISSKELYEIEEKKQFHLLDKVLKSTDLCDLGKVYLETRFHYINNSPDKSEVLVYSNSLSKMAPNTFESIIGIKHKSSYEVGDNSTDVGIGQYFSTLEEAFEEHEKQKMYWEKK